MKKKKKNRKRKKKKIIIIPILFLCLWNFLKDFFPLFLSFPTLYFEIEKKNCLLKNSSSSVYRLYFFAFFSFLLQSNCWKSHQFTFFFPDGVCSKQLFTLFFFFYPSRLHSTLITLGFIFSPSFTSFHVISIHRPSTNLSVI